MRLKDLNLSEGWARHELAAQPELLGLPSSYEPMQERVQHGRLDLLFSDPEGSEAVLVELQRGNVDLSHLTRLIEYAAAEEASNPSRTYRSILVAEGFTGKVGRLAHSLARQKVIDLWTMSAAVRSHKDAELSLSKLEVAAARQYDAKNFEQKWTSEPWYPVVARIFQHLTRHDPSCSPKFNKSFVGVQVNGGTYNSVAVKRCGRSAFRLELKLEHDAQIAAMLEVAGLNYVYQDGGEARRNFNIRIPHDTSHQSITTLLPFIAQAHDRWVNRASRQA